MSPKLTGFWLAALFCPPLFAGTLTVTVKDPGQALVGNAVVEVTGADNIARSQSTDTSGRAAFEQLAAGTYRVAVTKDGFANWEGTAKVAEKPVSLAVALRLAAVSSSVRVTARRSPLVNSDPNYQALRTGKLTRVYQVSNLVLTRDAGTLTFRSGSFSFLPPVLGHVTTGVFVGDGNFQLKTNSELAAIHIRRMSGSDSLSEDFTAAVFFFSDATFDEVKAHSQLVDGSPAKHEEELKRVRGVIQTRIEPNSKLRPLTQLERMLNFEDIPNYDAEILAEIYNGDVGEQKGSFRAFVRGKKYSDLRYIVNPHGAMPVLQAPEEVALILFDPNSFSDGVWYLGHRASEAKPDSKEEKRLIAPEHYRIEAGIGGPNALGNQPNLTVTCDMKFHALVDGVRMAKMNMIADLQVSRVTWNGNELPFVEESRSHDGSFYLQMPEALVKGRTYDVTFEYAGGEVLQSNNGIVPPGRIWYPTPVGGASRATYDMTFRIPRDTLLLASGKEERKERQGTWDVSEWKSDVPITQAVFRWLAQGVFKTQLEQTTGTQISVYMALAGRGALPQSSGDMLIDIGNALRTYNAWFGKSTFENVAVMVENSSDSLPGVVFAHPILTAGFSSIVAQRMVRSNGRAPSLDPRMRTGLDEAFASLISLQWWGNTITPASFHDRWLSVGLGSFSASVYDTVVNNGDYKERWDMAREGLLGKNRFGWRPNDAGPVWMSLLDDSPNTPAASYVLNATKGGYIIQMLRSIFWTPGKGDGDFQDMMKDFVGSYANSRVTTEDFKQVVEKHMKPVMDLDGNHRMDWFFNEWVYGIEVPSYKLEYSMKTGNGETVIEGKLTQSGVSPSFKMLVPIFGEMPGKKDRLGVVAITGSSTVDFKLTSTQRPKQVLLNINHDVLSDKAEVVTAKR